MKKCVTVFANISITEEVLAVLEKCKIENYSRFPRMIGQGSVTGPRLDSHVWPGANTALQIILEEKEANRLMDELQKLRDSETGRQSGIYAYMTSVERALD